MRILAIVAILVGLAAIVFGVLFIPQAGSAEDEIAAQVAPLKIDEVDAHYDMVTAAFNQAMAAEEPSIRAGQAAPSALYNYYAAQRALLGLAKSNLGTAKFVRLNGIIDIMVGLGLVAAGYILLMKNWKTA